MNAERIHLIERLNDVLGAQYVFHRPAELMLYEYDGSVLDQATPAIVVAPGTTAEVAAVMRAAHELGAVVVPRGAGTGLSGGSIPAAGGVVLATSRMNRLLDCNPINRSARVQAGMVNLELSQLCAPLGLHFAPDPSSQRSSTIGGNLAENAGGPHCLKYGVTSNHILCASVVLADGSIVELGSEAPDAPGYDLLGAFVGSEGTLGLASEISVRLTPDPEAIQTFLAIFDQLEDASRTVSAIIAAGIIPAALEMLEGRGIEAVEAAVQAGYPAGARAVLLIEIDGLHEDLTVQARRIAEICAAHQVRELRSANDPQQRARLWAGRKGALAACARIAPHYHIQDGVVPRSRLTEVLKITEQVAERHNVTIVNIFHAGDGNLHPLILFDLAEPGVRERAIAAGEEMLRACVDAGGTISGEHGIGLEKRDYMSWIFSETDLQVMLEFREVFDPHGRLNPCKLLPTGASCGEVRHAQGAARAVAAGAWL